MFSRTKKNEAGEPASDELAAVAEQGDAVPLRDALDADPRVRDVEISGGPLGPGQSVTVYVSARGAREISMATMMILVGEIPA